MAKADFVSPKRNPVSSKADEQKIGHLLTRNVEEVIEKGHLHEALRSGKKLRVKLGIDPTGEKIHIGRAVQLWKLREFQDLGHTIILIIGDFTAQIGDPSDKLEKRPFLSKAQVAKNLKSYLPQIEKILNLKKIEVRYNSEWLGKLDLREIGELADLFTFQQILERRNFKERWEKHQDISYREGMYPLMQGYDSVAVKADVELGGTDQLFNLLAGRKIQARYGQKPQDIMITGMLNGLDGRKMSTSWGNVINVADAPDEQYGKLMSMKDGEIISYFTLATSVPLEEIRRYERQLANREANPKSVKEKLAYEVVRRYHGDAAAEKAGAQFDALFSRRATDDAEIPDLKVGTMTVLALVLAAVIAKSKSEARRLIVQGGVQINGKPFKDPQEMPSFSGGETIKLGKRHFFRAKIL